MPLLRPASGTSRLGGLTATAAAMGMAGWLAWSVTPVPWEVVAFGRETASLLAESAPGIVKEIPNEPGDANIFCTYVGEGANVSVAVTETREGVRRFHGAGKIQASTAPTDMRLQRMLGHIPALVHRKPESVLVVACGAGVTAGTFVLHPDVKRVVICDIEPLVPTVVTPMFGEQNYHVVDGIAGQNPHTVNGKQVEVVYDDGRHFLRTTQEKFDIITSDPIDPWVKGCAALNTVEYYRMCRDHLNPGGSVCLWIPLYESNLETAKSVIATFFQVFPHGILWTNEHEGNGYDAVLFGQAEPTMIDVGELQRRLDRPDHQLVKQSLREVGFGTRSGRSDGDGAGPEEGIDLLATYSGQASLLKEWSRGAQINTDRNLRLQYLAGMWLNSNMGERDPVGHPRVLPLPRPDVRRLAGGDFRPEGGIETSRPQGPCPPRPGPSRPVSLPAVRLGIRLARSHLTGLTNDDRLDPGRPEWMLTGMDFASNFPPVCDAISRPRSRLMNRGALCPRSSTRVQTRWRD